MNALGRIKLMFPNPYSVYIHDTPTRGLFAEAERFFSHGCVRVDDPLGLAEVVLGDPLQWNRGTLEATISTGESRTIPLPEPLPVFVLYWTAWPDPDGHVRFYGDRYDRDAAVLADLDGDAAPGTREGSYW